MIAETYTLSVPEGYIANVEKFLWDMADVPLEHRHQWSPLRNGKRYLHLSAPSLADLNHLIRGAVEHGAEDPQLDLGQNQDPAIVPEDVHRQLAVMAHNWEFTLLCRLPGTAQFSYVFLTAPSRGATTSGLCLDEGRYSIVAYDNDSDRWKFQSAEFSTVEPSDLKWPYPPKSMSDPNVPTIAEAMKALPIPDFLTETYFEPTKDQPHPIDPPV